ncbi:hypothetical protein [Burkholderia sp. Ac-20379]|uniref:hypothetical protein n=1 Tax=Burkholderia sp. Ac-20379 TaxID=2703900 RepID=UPI0019817048|nr:hypothetical protein [Burkholderia sp. Ac-20379]MBN3728109.1 hypothetical protein [Burkholderia sp. Ac-20379]
MAPWLLFGNGIRKIADTGIDIAPNRECRLTIRRPMNKRYLSNAFFLSQYLIFLTGKPRHWALPAFSAHGSAFRKAAPHYQSAGINHDDSPCIAPEISLPKISFNINLRSHAAHRKIAASILFLPGIIDIPGAIHTRVPRA